MSEHAEQIRQFLLLGRLDMAETGLRDALRESPDSVVLQVLSARLQLARGKADDALVSVERTLVNAPQDLQARLVLYQCLEELKRYSEAEDVLLDLLREQPESPELIAAYANLCLRNLQLEKALRLAEHALRLEPDNRSAKVTLAVVRFIVVNDAEAHELVKQILAEDPNSVMGMGLVLQLLIEKGKYTEALRLAQMLLRAFPQSEQFAEVVVELKATCSPIGRLYWPLNRWGWAASAVIWVLFVVLYMLATVTGLIVYVSPLLFLYLCWVVSSWFMPYLLKTWYRWRGV
ncbi:MAG: tetratricopeptide repeat protein [Pseudomonadota bacterium]